MGINNCGRDKRAKSGAKRVHMQKKRKNMMGRQPSNTRIGDERVRQIRVRGGNTKMRGLRLNSGDFTFHSTGTTLPTRIEKVVYHPSCNELMRTNTLTKSSVVRIAAEPFASEIEKADLQSKDSLLLSLYEKGFLYGIITSRPGQVGCANGYVLQGEELEFYVGKTKASKKDY